MVAAPVLKLPSLPVFLCNDACACVVPLHIPVLRSFWDVAPAVLSVSSSKIFLFVACASVVPLHQPLLCSRKNVAAAAFFAPSSKVSLCVTCACVVALHPPVLCSRHIAAQLPPCRRYPPRQSLYVCCPSFYTDTCYCRNERSTII